MRKVGCLILSGALFIICAWKGYVDFVAPKRLSEKAVQTTSQYAFKCAQDCFDKKQERTYESKNDLLCKSIIRKGTQLEICQNPVGGNGYHSGDHLLKQSQFRIQIKKGEKTSANFTIDIGKGKTALLDRNIAYAFSNANVFFSWIKHIDAPKQDLLILKIIDSRTGESIAEKEIFARTCCLVNPTIDYDQKTSKLLFSWNDWNCPEDQNLFYGTMDIVPSLQRYTGFKFIQLNSGDKWDKRNPAFFKDGEKHYLTYATGDRWGWASYSGKYSIGICIIDDRLEPVGYRMVALRQNIGKALKIENGYLYYEILSEDVSKLEEIRKIRIIDTFELKPEK
jgi:hypothetical protein